MVFSGSDWCKPCMQLKTDILSQADFKNYSDDQLVYLNLDFPYRKKNRLSPEQTLHNEQLAEKFNPKGQFPLVVLLDSNQNLLANIPYKKNMSTEDFINSINNAK